MAALKWDQTGERFYEIGVQKGVLYIQNTDGTYENGVVWNGLTNVTESPDGAEAQDLWADNIKYATLRSTENAKGSIEAYMYPDEFEGCMGNTEVATGAYIGQQTRSSFGFCYRSEIGNDVGSDPDDGYKLHIVWNASVSPTEMAHATINDSPDPETMSWEYTTNPVNVTGHKPTATMTINSMNCDKDKLATLEAKLYGDDTNEATLPTPDEIIAILSAA